MPASFSCARPWEANSIGEDVEQLKQRWPLLDYLQQQNWAARPVGYDSEFVGLCPLHQETRPSFYVNARKNLFYCHGCGQGGDLIRFVELSRHLSFRQSLAYLEQQSAPPVDSVDSATVLNEAAAFYQEQLDRYPEALRYLERRGLQILGPYLFQAPAVATFRCGTPLAHTARESKWFEKRVRDT